MRQRHAATFLSPPFRRLGFLLPIALASACVSAPHVQYVRIEEPGDAARGVPQFRLAGSRVSLGLTAPGDTPKKAAPPPPAVGPFGTTQELLAAKPAVLVTPAEAGPIYGIVPKPSVFSSIALNVSYFDNTRLVKSIGAPVTDNTLKVISSVGGFLTVLAPLAVRGHDVTPELSLPVVLDFADEKKLEEALSYAGAPVPGATAWWYRLRAMPDKAAEDATAFFAPGRTLESFPYSACLSGTLELWAGSDPSRRFKSGDVAGFPVKIADPRHVRAMALPAKGTVVMHTVCGADVKAENADLAGTFEVLEALAKQVEAIYTAASKK